MLLPTIQARAPNASRVTPGPGVLRKWDIVIMDHLKGAGGAQARTLDICKCKSGPAERLDRLSDPISDR